MGMSGRNSFRKRYVEMEALWNLASNPQVKRERSEPLFRIRTHMYMRDS